MGNPRRVAAGRRFIEGGIGLALTTPVESGAIVVVGGQLDDDRTVDHLKAVVRWCTGETDGTFRAGLEFLVAPEQANLSNPHTLDCYRTMQPAPMPTPLPFPARIDYSPCDTIPTTSKPGIARCSCGFPRRTRS